MRKPTQLLLMLLFALLSSVIAADQTMANGPNLRLVPPIPGPVVTAFSVGAADWEPGHRGVDLSGSVGQPIRAAAGGTVRFSGLVVDREVISIDHGGWWTTYEPIQPRVARGAVVRRGEVIGYLARGHDCSATCLHWGLTNGSTYLNPLGFVRPLEVRLLPTRPIARP